ncbi:MAG: 2-amino-4-hydroxy-6-hydroxymethyldihydropteridine diphosphokinase [Gammaproteobacteria bacterium]|nr:2-amino-4-hydroxy-6-hydroxymethyldihydropteridine diphosphokinase [Gammaproteobacteria bacterium]
MSDNYVDAYIGLGANLGDPIAQLQSALRVLACMEHSELVAVSPFYRSPPMAIDGEIPDQPEYINAVAHLRTKVSAQRLLAALLYIEQTHGRVRDGHKWDARTLDLDLLLFGDAIINEPGLQVPHPGLVARAFVLYPLYDLQQNILLPGINNNLAQLLQHCPLAGLQKINEIA